MTSPTRRKGQLTLIALAMAAGASIAASNAMAADALPPPPVFEGPAITPVELGSGWYIRGDIGYVSYNDAKADYAGVPFDTADLEDTISAGAGFGYKLTDLLRGDITLDYRFGSSFDGSTTAPGVGYTNENGKVSSWTGLANAYVDLGNWYGITPYVGAGIGFASNRVEDYNAFFYNNAGTLLGSFPVRPRERFGLAWALMAGAALDVGYGFSLDLGYRYVNLGEARTGFDLFGNKTRIKEIDAHEFRLGMRYMIE